MAKKKKFPITENSSLNPISYYGKTKLISEKLIKKECSRKFFKSICLRYFNVIGSNFKNKIGEIHHPPIHLIPIMIRNILLDKPVKIRSNFKTKDKSGIRDYIDVNDMAEAHYLCLKKIVKIKKNFLALNLGSRKYFSVKEILKIIHKKIKIKKIKIIFSKKLQGEPDKLLASGSLAKKMLGWKPKVKVETSISNMVLWEKYKLKNIKEFIH